MTSQFQPPPSGRGGRNNVGNAEASTGPAVPYMTERQTQAYLLARDTIRRIQRAASNFGATPGDAHHQSSAADGRNNSH